MSYPPYPGQPVPGGGAPTTANGPLRNVAFGILGAGVLATLGPFLTWGKLCGDSGCADSASRIEDANSGFLFVLVGLALAASGAVVAFGPTKQRAMATWGAVGAGGAGALLLIFEWMRNSEFGDALEEGFGVQGAKFEYSLGFYLVLLGMLGGLGGAIAIALGKVPETAARPGGYGSAPPGGWGPPGGGPGYPQPGYPQPGYPQPGYPQPGYPQTPAPGGYPSPGQQAPGGYPSPGQQAPGGYPSPGQQAPGGYPPGQQPPGGYPNSGGYPIAPPGGYPPPPGT